MEIDKEKYPRGKAEFSSFEDSEFEQRLRWAKMTIMDRFEHCLQMMDEHGPPKNQDLESGNEFLLIRKIN